MVKKSLLFGLMMSSGAFLFAQNDINNKLSVTTQMFLNERDGKEVVRRKAPAKEKELGLKLDESYRAQLEWNDGRIYAEPEVQNGVKYISTFIRVKNEAEISELEAKGVQVQCKFNDGLLTANIPVDSLESVANLSNVQRINVSPLMRPTTNAARTATNTGAVLTHSADAIAAGLPKVYDGTGVVLGVIDTGIDFQHIAFKDKNGNSRIKRAYVYNGSSAKEYTSITSSAPTTDDSGEDHGTHTSSTAGGSSVIINGSNVTVTDNHASATYGGIAPGADLYLAGVKGLSSTYMANAFQKICNYADSQGKPVVVSNSWGSQYGPHDGTGDFASITSQYFGDNHPNHICLFAASNDAGRASGNGGFHASGTSSSSNPFGTVLRSHAYSNTDDGYYYSGIIANAWSRSTISGSLACKIFVLDSSTGAVKTSVTVTRGNSSYKTVSGLSSYYDGTLTVYFDYINSSKSQILLQTSGLTSKGTTQTTKNGSAFYNSKYTLAIQIYPTSGSTTIDTWAGTSSYFSSTPSTSGYNWAAGSDNSSISDEATMPSVIAVGAYVSKNSVKDYNGTTHSLAHKYTVGDIAYFSSYQEAGQGATGQLIPWITAPGATVVAGVNHYHKTGGYIDNTYANYEMYRVNSNTTNPYGSMEGTSMATPVAAGVVALWLQAAKETNQSLTTTAVKNIMKNTAINDTYTTRGANASHFGNGKINALGGIQAILGTSGGSTTPDPQPSQNPSLTVSKSSVSLATTTGTPVSATFTVTGTNITNTATVSLTNSNGVFSVTPATISASALAQGKTVTVTFTPQTSGTYTGKVTITSGTASVNVNLTATATQPETTTGGTASDNYLDLRKYNTINNAGVYGVNNFYSIVSDGSNAWISVPAYGAYYSSDYQGWISASNISTVRTTWSKADVFGGYSSFFNSSSNARAITSSSYGSTAATETFYVSNCTGVKLYGYGRSTSSWWSSSTGSITIKAYQCTKNANGSLTASSTVAASNSSTTNGAVAIPVTGLDANKIYKVVVSVSKSYLYEVAFQTSLSNINGYSVSSFVGDLPQEATAIDDVTTDEPADNKIYTINGQYVGNDIKALKPGLYIINGKKVNVR